MAKSGDKSIRGKGEFYDQVKDQQVILLLTPTGKNGLDALARSLGLSRSEFCEQLGRGLLKVSKPKKVKTSQ